MMYRLFIIRLTGKLKLNLLTILTSLISTFCSSPVPVVSENEYHIIYFRKIGQRIPAIKVLLNQKEAWFIVDTGASFTVLNNLEEENYGFFVKENRNYQPKKINGISGKLELHDTFNCKMEMGNLFIKHYPWKSGNISMLCDTIKEKENIRIVGILGSDFLQKYRININFDHQTISWKD